MNICNKNKSYTEEEEEGEEKVVSIKLVKNLLPSVRFACKLALLLHYNPLKLTAERRSPSHKGGC